MLSKTKGGGIKNSTEISSKIKWIKSGPKKPQVADPSAPLSLASISFSADPLGDEKVPFPDKRGRLTDVVFTQPAPGQAPIKPA